MARTANEPLDVGGITGRDLDNLALALVADTPLNRREDLKYVLEKALQILQSQNAPRVQEGDRPDGTFEIRCEPPE